jgi:hypothetical protein
MEDFIGTRFGMWLVIGKGNPYVNPSNGKKTARWTCECDCGTVRDTTTRSLTKGISKSCGCRWTTHGGTGTREHKIWSGMRQRCYNFNNKDFPRYGAKGIGVHSEWFASFSAFLRYMGPCPEGMSIDRIDSTGNYEPNNVRWATDSEQNHNRGKMKSNKSGREGVFELKSGEGFQASIMFEKKKIHLGTFKTFEAAKEAREQAELKYLGQIKVR